MRFLGAIVALALIGTLPAHALSKEGYWSPELEAWRACRADKECVLVENTFPCHCGLLSVNRKHLKPFEAESRRMKEYWDANPNQLFCEPCLNPPPKSQQPACRGQTCVAEPPA
jgi:hypothetical protein